MNDGVESAELILRRAPAGTKAKGAQVPLIVEAKTADGVINEWFGSLTVR